MPVLLLARGDEESRDLLRKSIEARYGARPPAFDSLKVEFSGKVHTRIGPIKTWVPLELSTQFILPDAMRLDFTAKPAGVPVRRGIESYDGEHLRTLVGNGNPTVSTDENAISSLQQRLWAMAAVLLTPLGEHYVELKQEGDSAFSARNKQNNAVVYVHLVEGTHWIDEVAVNCYNPDKGKIQRYSLRLSSELVSFDELLLPNKISAFWDGEPFFEAEPVNAENDPEIPMAEFTLGKEVATS